MRILSFFYLMERFFTNSLDSSIKRFLLYVHPSFDIFLRVIRKYPFTVSFSVTLWFSVSNLTDFIFWTGENWVKWECFIYSWKFSKNVSLSSNFYCGCYDRIYLLFFYCAVWEVGWILVWKICTVPLVYTVFKHFATLKVLLYFAL